MHVPQEAVHARLREKQLRRANPISGNFQSFRVRLHRHIRARIPPDWRAFVVFDLDRYRARGIFR